MSKQKSHQLNGFQSVVKSSEEWEKLQTLKGLIVADLHCGWCGPCTSIIPTFKKLYQSILQYGLFEIHFAVVECDKIEDIKSRFSIGSEPTFQFITEGKLRDTVVGVNIPRIIKTVAKYLPTEALTFLQSQQNMEDSILNAQQRISEVSHHSNTSNTQTQPSNSDQKNEEGNEENDSQFDNFLGDYETTGDYQHEMTPTSTAPNSARSTTSNSDKLKKGKTTSSNPNSPRRVKKSNSLDRSKPVEGTSNTFMFVGEIKGKMKQ
eukprot:TRINITY_DN1910_c0_g1_i5.p1 TRINITY_DN1910_c0_g1~~TRINITY_DN1910_c0_g1_i5.p1  ORF type:complete len:263 (-),score=69.22 TRINITY_DN1910_c0_g1_i5:362-1150(-)